MRLNESMYSHSLQPDECVEVVREVLVDVFLRE